MGALLQQETSKRALNAHAPHLSGHLERVHDCLRCHLHALAASWNARCRHLLAMLPGNSLILLSDVGLKQTGGKPPGCPLPAGNFPMVARPRMIYSHIGISKFRGGFALHPLIVMITKLAVTPPRDAGGELASLASEQWHIARLPACLSACLPAWVGMPHFATQLFLWLAML